MMNQKNGSIPPHKCHENLVEMIASEDDLEGCENAGDEEVLENDDNIGGKLGWSLSGDVHENIA